MKTWLAALAMLLHSVILSAQERITLLFVGDLMQHQAQIDAARTPEGTPMTTLPALPWSKNR